MKVGTVSIYPPPESIHAKFGGVASYTKNLVSCMSDHCGVIVFANKLSHVNNDYYEDGITVCRCWNKGVIYPLQIVKAISNHDVDIVHIQHEIFLYGSILSTMVFPLLLIFTKLLRKPTIVTIHGVLPLSKINKQFLKENGINGPSPLMRAGLLLLIRSITQLSTAIVVHEEKLREGLISEYNCSSDKINVIHHGIEERSDSIEKVKAKKILGLSGKKVIFSFGYIAPYKGVELLIESAKFLRTANWTLIIAGGLHPRLSGDPNYQKYVSALREKASKVSEDRIIFKGFIPEEEIPLYFSAADLVVFPYKVCMHASGPLAVSISFEKPFLISNSFKGIFRGDVLFKNDPRNIARKVNHFFEDAKMRFGNLKYVKGLKKESLWDRVVEQLYNLYLKAMAHARKREKFSCGGNNFNIKGN